MIRPFVLVVVLDLVLDRVSWFLGRGRGGQRARARIASWSQCMKKRNGAFHEPCGSGRKCAHVPQEGSQSRLESATASRWRPSALLALCLLTLRATAQDSSASAARLSRDYFKNGDETLRAFESVSRAT